MVSRGPLRNAIYCTGQSVSNVTMPPVVRSTAHLRQTGLDRESALHSASLNTCVYTFLWASRASVPHQRAPRFHSMLVLRRGGGSSEGGVYTPQLCGISHPVCMYILARNHATLGGRQVGRWGRGRCVEQVCQRGGVTEGAKGARVRGAIIHCAISERLPLIL